MNTFKPLLAATLTSSCNDEDIKKAIQKLKYPVIVTEKVDGIRAIKLEDGLYSRTLKRIPSKYLNWLAESIPVGMDMELYNPERTFQEIQSAVMTEEGDRAIGLGIKFVLLDWYLPHLGYQIRLEEIRKWLSLCLQFIDRIDARCMTATIASTPDTLYALYQASVINKREGICFRLPNSPYIQKKGENRSTLKEQYLVKLTCAKIGEAKVIGFEEKMINLASATITFDGRTKRKTGRELPANTLGALIVEANGVTFNIGTGFDDNQRKEIWENKTKWLGAIVSYQAKTVGEKEKPRMPVFRGRRLDI